MRNARLPPLASCTVWSVQVQSLPLRLLPAVSEWSSSAAAALPPTPPLMRRHPGQFHVLRAEETGTAGFHHHLHHGGIGDGAGQSFPPELLHHHPRSPNPSSKSSSNLTVAAFAPQPLGNAMQNGVAATLGMVEAPGMAPATEAGRFCLERAAAMAHQLDNWGDSLSGSGVVVTSPLTTETSTDLDDSGDKQRHASMGGGGGGGGGRRKAGCVDSSEKTGDQKMERRLAQNREAARKSRIKKKAYLQQLESSRSKLEHLEQELQRARQQGMFIAGGSGDHSSGGALAFDLEYARWLDDHQRHINNLRVAVIANMTDEELRILVESVMLHYDELFRLKSFATKSDVFHVLSGMWMSPAERFFMWLGGFRSSELLKVLASQLEPLTDQQLMGICSLQQSSQQAEDALSQGMEALAAAAGVGPLAGSAADNVTNYMGQMAIAMGKLSTLENFLRQGDLLRQQTLQQLHRILTTRQAARALLVMSDYFSRLRALSSLWLARPRD